ncbi:MAG: AlkZ family DNA glycosylase [Methanomassiliicoccus sp.]|nr:AlkZ family DNA glycosylase [Methanomassiliicoccus sp.]
MALNDLACRRLCSQTISRSAFKRPEEAVSRLAAVQAQDRPGASWAIGLRVPGMTKEDIERSVASRKIVRTWLLRGTLHFTAAEDVRWMLDLVAPRLISRARYRNEQLRLDDGTFDRSREVLTDALEDGEQLARSETMSVLEKAGISTAGQRGYHILWHLALTGHICFGPMAGKEPTFVLLDEWIPPVKEMSRERSLEEMARRYFLGHGPAKLEDLAWWSGLTTSDARKAIDMARPGLAEEVRDGVSYWTGPPCPGGDDDVRLHLLPPFDEYIVGYQDRSAVLDRDRTKGVISSNGFFYPAMVIDGQVRGTWRVIKERDAIKLEARSFSRLSSSDVRDMKRAAARYETFIGRPVTSSCC